MYIQHEQYLKRSTQLMPSRDPPRPRSRQSAIEDDCLEVEGSSLAVVGSTVVKLGVEDVAFAGAGNPLAQSS